MEMIVIEKKELSILIKSAVNDALNGIPNKTETKKIQMEGGIDFASEILREKAGIQSKKTIYKWSHEGRIPREKRGKRLWFNRKQLEQWVEDGMPNLREIQAANQLAKKI